ncbi:MAG: flagellar biosynthesis anti-sigma factor FlgM [Clostridiaceae bacterium]|nr:flagellar biosynthesis anti-sigma factor FlgM [Clostridiaceae bacterium]MBW4860022.1 flagellar biosynthesis anti-sigma factor FlgM [Clostridiaceae bacterium]MBW4867112.1 flagellar biosynthesis anti-sigma factor FlgM [Clostridiaceae bacterium]
MKINRIDKVSQVYENQQIKKVGLKNRYKRDELNLSNKAIEYKNAFNEIKELPEIRENKTKKIKDEITTGTYKIDGRKIVDKMFEKANFDKKV